MLTGEGLDCIFRFKSRCDHSLSLRSSEWPHQDLNLGPTGYEPAALTN